MDVTIIIIKECIPWFVFQFVALKTLSRNSFPTALSYHGSVLSPWWQVSTQKLFSLIAKSCVVTKTINRLKEKQRHPVSSRKSEISFENQMNNFVTCETKNSNSWCSTWELNKKTFTDEIKKHKCTYLTNYSNLK